MTWKPWVRWRMILWITIAFVVDSEVLAQQKPRNVVAAPARLSVAGSPIVFRTIDPLSSTEREIALRARLAEPWGMQFHCIDLQQLVAQLNNVVPASLNDRALEEIGLSADESVKVDVVADETPLMTLAVALRPLDLTWSIRAGRCMIETIEAAEESLVVRVYDVTPLVIVDFAGSRDVPIGRKADFTSLEDLIQTTIRPDTWEALGGPSSFGRFIIGQRCLLTIATTTQTHFEIESLLNHLNELGHPREPQVQRVVLKKTNRLPKFGRDVSTLESYSPGDD